MLGRQISRKEKVCGNVSFEMGIWEVEKFRPTAPEGVLILGLAPDAHNKCGRRSRKVSLCAGLRARLKGCAVRWRPGTPQRRDAVQPGCMPLTVMASWQRQARKRRWEAKSSH